MPPRSKSSTKPTVSEPPTTQIQRPPAELLHAEELQRLRDRDTNTPRPQNWQLTPRSVLDFILGNPELNITPKFVGTRSLLERCIVALATNRGLMLIGEPGTAKSYLSELLTAAISNDSTLTIQGSAGTTEDAMKYSWNYALLLAEGPTDRALVPAPLHRGMQQGKIVRFEEITRCPLEMQDTLLSILSDRVMAIPEMEHEGRNLYAQVGFNIIATANTRDRGVNEMSAALKRRFNFETIPPINNLRQELELVQQQTDQLLAQANIPISLPPELTEILVTTFHELRTGTTTDGKALEPLSSVMSTAEAVSVGYAAGIHGFYYNEGEVTAAHIVQSLLGSAIKDSAEDVKKLQHYFNQVVKDKSGDRWKQYYAARKFL
jgi:MoxR-like ATPase